MQHNFKGEVAIITGGGRGIGAAIGQSLAAAGASVILADLDLDSARTVQHRIEAEGGQALAVEADVTQKSAGQNMVQVTLDRFEKIDILVNSAGITSIHHFTEISEMAWDRVMAVNAKGTFFCCQLVAPHMMTRRRGRIINIASQAGITGQPYMAHYVASKFAVVGLTQSLALELGPYGITVNAICPGDVATDMHTQVSQALSELHGLSRESFVAQAIARCPLGRLGTPQDVADAVLFLASEAGGFITGEALNASGGLEFH
jgi:meso-butanediol dehydrogenase/(S,S)-butanediol dehydrogenase/diacetyl reductase